MKSTLLLLNLLLVSIVFAQSSAFEKGLEAYNNGEYSLAVEHYTKHLKNKKSANAYFNRAISLFRTQKYIEAIEDFTIVINMDAEDYEAWYNRGLAYFETGEIKKAYFDSKKALELNPDFSNSYTSIGMCYHAWEKYDKAIESYTKGLSIKETANKYYRRALTYQEMSRFDAAEKDFNQALSIRQDPEYYGGRADMFYKLEKYDECIANYDTAIALNNMVPFLYYNRGLAYYTQKEDKKALEDFKNAYLLDTNDIDIKWYLALCNYSLTNYEESLEYYTKVEKQDASYTYLSDLNKKELKRKISLGNKLWYIVALIVLALLALFLFSKLYNTKEEAQKA